MIDYKSISDRIKNNSGLVTALNVLDKAITYTTVIIYILFLIDTFFLALQGNSTLLYRSLIVPGVSFIVISIYRKMAGAPRPYQVYNFTPALKKDTYAKSFPSRHVFSIFMVAYTCMQYWMIIGIILIFMGIILAVVRVIGGVHFIKDVIAGAVIATIIAFVCYWILGGVFGLLMLPF